MSKSPRLPSAVEDEAPHLGNVLAHAPEIMSRFSALYGEYWQGGSLPQDLKEMTRLRNARVTDCGYWRQVRFDGAVRAGLTEEQADLVEDGYADHLPAKLATALDLTDRIVQQPTPVDGTLQDSLADYFTAAESAELALGVCLFMSMSKVLITLGLEPEEMALTILPTPVVEPVVIQITDFGVSRL